MRKKIELAVLLLFLAVLVLLSKNLQKLVSSGNVTAKNKIIVLDSGHGGDDPGKIGVNQAKEKDVNLEIARKIKKRLEKKGWEVVMTREKDEMLGDPHFLFSSFFYLFFQLFRNLFFLYNLICNISCFLFFYRAKTTTGKQRCNCDHG